ncbi:hypothetical protein NIES4103_36340 [Nostoc sp. NIES-4103]|nr:hypothetical protein NIES4103_36340 [Nostoc sp. NIES-4103]
MGVNLTQNPCKGVIFSYLTYYQDPRHPTPVLSKAKTAPPRTRGGVGGGVKRMWSQRLSLSWHQ